MGLSEGFIVELEREAKSTERILNRVPKEKLEWRPHVKSTSLGDLAWHIASLPRNGVLGLREGSREVTGTRPAPRTGDDFVVAFRRNLDELKAALAATPDEVLLSEKFSFMRDGVPLVSMPKGGFIRTVVINHSIHHRGQLTVYLRLLDVPVPAMYGTSADENAFARAEPRK